MHKGVMIFLRAHREASALVLHYVDPDRSFQEVDNSSTPGPQRFDPPCSLACTSTDEEAIGSFTILELGSGTGFVGIQTARLLDTRRRRERRPGSSSPCSEEKDLVILTDLSEVCPLLEKNLTLHLLDGLAGDGWWSCEVLVEPLSWGDTEHAERLADMTSARLGRVFTHILCCDLVGNLVSMPADT
jgi:hypothetical protein